MLLIVAFFIFFAAQKADGIVSLFGNILGALLVLGAVFHIVGMFVPGMAMKMGMHDDGMMRVHGMRYEDAQLSDWRLGRRLPSLRRLQNRASSGTGRAEKALT